MTDSPESPPGKSHPAVREDDKRHDPLITGAGGNHRGHVVTQGNIELVKLLAKVDNQDKIAQKLGIHRSTFNKYYKDHFWEGRNETIHAIGAKLIEKALAGDNSCMKYYLSTQGDWTTKHELSGPGGGPIPMKNVEVDLSKLSDEELEAYGVLARRIAPDRHDAGSSDNRGDSGIAESV